MHLHQVITEKIRLILQLEEHIPPDANLIEYGLHSLSIIQLVDELEKEYQQPLAYADFAMAPTINEWVGLLNMDEATPANLQHITTEPTSQLHEMRTVALSEMQYAYWAGRKSGDTSAHWYVEFTGKGMDVVRLEDAVYQLVKQHPMLNVMITDAGEQQIASITPPTLSIDDLRQVDAQQTVQFLEQKRHKMGHQTLPINQGQVIDISLTLLPKDKYHLHIDMDMIAVDALSFLMVVEGLAQAYRKHPNTVTTPSSYNYFDYLAWRNHDGPYQTARLADQTWWQARLDNIAPIPELPLIIEGSRDQPNQFKQRCHQFTTAEKSVLQQLAANHQISVASLLLTLFSLTIATWSRSNRFRLNLPVFKREKADDAVESMVGDFANFILLNILINPEDSIIEACQRLQQELTLTADHQAYPGIQILRDLTKNSQQVEIAPIVFTSGLDLADIFSESVIDILGQPIACLSQGPKVDLDVQVAYLNKGLLVNWDIRINAFKGTSADEMFAHYISLIDTIIGDSHQLIQPINTQETHLVPNRPQLPKDESHHVKPLGLMFFEQAIRTPQAIAIIHDHQHVSYQALMEQITCIAQNLADTGIKPNTLVAVALPKTPSLIAVILALWSIGASYFVIGRSRTQAQWKHMFGHSNYPILINDDTEDKAYDAIHIIKLDTLLIPQKNSAINTFAPITNTDYLAYQVPIINDASIEIIKVSHERLHQSIQGLSRIIPINEKIIMLSTAPTQSDRLLIDLCLTLTTGGQLVLIDPIIAAPPTQIIALIQTHHINTLHSSPAYIFELVNQAEPKALATLRWVFCRHARVAAALGQKLRQHAHTIELIALYGLPQTALYTLYGIYNNTTNHTEDFIPYQHLFPTATHRIVNELVQDCPNWVMGELWIFWAYLTDNNIRADDHSLIYAVHKDALWFKTGQLAYFNDQTAIMFYTPLDQILKRSGYFIDIDVIAAKILTVYGVTQAVVVASSQTSPPIFTAFVVSNHTDSAIMEQNIRQALAQRLPHNLIPQHYQFIERFPLTIEGDIDRTILIQNAQDPYTLAPITSSLERVTTYIFAKIIGIDVDIMTTNDDFFDHGGDSLLATHLVVTLNQYFKGAQISITDIFIERTPHNIAKTLEVQLPQLAHAIAELFLKVVEDLGNEYVSDKTA